MRKYLFIEEDGDIKADTNVLIDGDLEIDGVIGIELNDLSDVTLTDSQLHDLLSRTEVGWENKPLSYQPIIDGGSFT